MDNKIPNLIERTRKMVRMKGILHFIFLNTNPENFICIGLNTPLNPVFLFM